MTKEEFSNTFDTLLNSYSVTPEFGEGSSKVEIVLDEYEKSVFLTEAQEQLVIELYTGRTPLGIAFESTEEARTYLRGLIKTARLSPKIEEEKYPMSSDSKLFVLPSDLLFITLESVKLGDNAGCKSGEDIPVIPVAQDEYHSISENPFRGANKRRALRLDLSGNMVEIISKYDIQEYKVRYLRRPKPIVLATTELDGYNEVSECELDESLHRPILERAVLLAYQSKGAKSR